MERAIVFQYGVAGLAEARAQYEVPFLELLSVPWVAIEDRPLFIYKGERDNLSSPLDMEDGSFEADRCSHPPRRLPPSHRLDSLSKPNADSQNCGKKFGRCAGRIVIVSITTLY